MPFSSASSGEFQPDFLAAQADLAGVGVVDAGDDLHQRRLAGAVLAHQRVDGAALEAELDIVERDDAGKCLADALDLRADSLRPPSPRAAVVAGWRMPCPSLWSLRRGRRVRFAQPAAATPVERLQFLVRYWSMLAGVTSSNGI